MSILIRNTPVLPLGSADNECDRADIRIDGSVIKAISPDLPPPGGPPPRVIDAAEVDVGFTRRTGGA